MLFSKNIAKKQPGCQLRHSNNAGKGKPAAVILIVAGKGRYF